MDKNERMIAAKRLISHVSKMTDAEREQFSATAGVTLTCEGRTLGMFNSIFLSMQSGTYPTVIGGFRQWQRQGRQVPKGCHALGYIYVPMVRHSEDDEDHVQDEVRFRLVPVWDISQTEEKAA